MLKIEPRVSIFLVIKSAVQLLSLVLLWKVLLVGRVFMGVRLEYRLFGIVVFDGSKLVVSLVLLFVFVYI